MYSWGDCAVVVKSTAQEVLIYTGYLTVRENTSSEIFEVTNNEILKQLQESYCNCVIYTRQIVQQRKMKKKTAINIKNVQNSK